MALKQGRACRRNRQVLDGLSYIVTQRVHGDEPRELHVLSLVSHIHTLSPSIPTQRQRELSDCRWNRLQVRSMLGREHINGYWH